MKYRCHILNPKVQKYLRKIFPKIMCNLPGSEIVEAGKALI